MKDRLGEILIALAAIAIGGPIIYFVGLLLFTILKFIAMTAWGILCSIWTIICIPFALLEGLFQCCGIFFSRLGQTVQRCLQRGKAALLFTRTCGIHFSGGVI